MKVTDTERHERVLHVTIDKGWLAELILKAVAEKTGISLADLRTHGKVEIEPNMEGSPSYQSGHRAVVRATIPLTQPEAR